MKKGFTLIEVLVVVLIIGILTSVALPQYRMAVDKARIKSVFPIMRAIIDAERLYKLGNDSYTTDLSELHVGVDATNLGVLSISTQGTYTSLIFYPKDWFVFIYAALERDYWLCYPVTARGRNLCKNLGCSGNIEVGYSGCHFTPR